MRRSLTFVAGFLLAAAMTVSIRGAALAANSQTVVIPPPAAATHLPRVVIYTLSTCPHCQEAKEYMTSHAIPFVNREVDSDDQHMQELMQIYDGMNVPMERRGVPLIVIADQIRLQGFNRERFQKEWDKLLTQRPSSPAKP